MTKRERFRQTLNHEQPERVVLDAGATGQTGINASTIYKLRKLCGLEEKPIKIIEPFQMLGEIDEELRDILGTDVIGIWNRGNMIGTLNEEYQPFTMPDGTPVLMPSTLTYDKDAQGGYVLYPSGDKSCEPSLHMTNDGSFFDNIERCKSYDENLLDALKDFKEDFSVATDEDARYWEKRSMQLYQDTDYGIIGILGGAGLGDVATVPGPATKHPKGIRTVEEWMLAHLLYPDYVKEVFALQTDVMLKNLERYKQAVGDRIDVVWISGTDFGTQISTFVSPDTFRDIYKPFYTTINDWVHQNTDWKTFFHTCGCIVPLLDDLHEMGVDCLNPVQCSAQGMDPHMLKDDYGDQFVFWGAAVDTQKTLPFGSVEDVKKEVRERLAIFSKGGGYVCASIHNIVANVPPENVLALFETIKGYSYGL